MSSIKVREELSNDYSPWGRRLLFDDLKKSIPPQERSSISTRYLILGPGMVRVAHRRQFSSMIWHDIVLVVEGGTVPR